jgi:methionyl-tRNA formyltransferase
VALRAIVAAGHEVAAVVTRADKRRGRQEAPGPSPVKAAALELGLPVSDRVEDAATCGAELGVVVAFGRIIKKDILDRLPMVNVHFSLLPRWRGAAPLERAILAGDIRTGVCLMAIDEGLDTGAVYRCESLEIGPDETADELRVRLSDLGARMVVEALDRGLGEPTAQQGEATYAEKVEPEDRHLHWTRPAVELHRVVRIGRAWTSWRGKRLLVLAARPAQSGEAGQLVPGQLGPGQLGPGEIAGDLVGTGDGRLRLVTVQPEGRPALAAVDWLRGARPQPGERLGL